MFDCRLMRISVRRIHAMVVVALWLAGSATMPAQTPDALRIRLANMEQDIAMLKAQVAQMRVDQEQLLRENESLRKQLELTRSAANERLTGYADLTTLNTRLESLRRELQMANEANRREIVAEVTRQMERLAVTTEEAMKTLAQSVDARPQYQPEVAFSEDYSREGQVYVVQPGDTLSRIASRYDSTVRDITNANKITDPTKIQVGQTLFIPQTRD